MKNYEVVQNVEGQWALQLEGIRVSGWYPWRESVMSLQSVRNRDTEAYRYWNDQIYQRVQLLSMIDQITEEREDAQHG